MVLEVRMVLEWCCHHPPQFEIRSSSKNGEFHLSTNQNPEVKQFSTQQTMVENTLKATILVFFCIPFLSVQSPKPDEIHQLSLPAGERLMTDSSSKFLGPKSGVCFFW